jgi:hypothetical protein
MKPVKLIPPRCAVEGAPSERDPILQPLREVGSLSKTQFWDLDEIYQALREANRLGIAPERLFSRPPQQAPECSPAG